MKLWHKLLSLLCDPPNRDSRVPWDQVEEVVCGEPCPLDNHCPACESYWLLMEDDHLEEEQY